MHYSIMQRFFRVPPHHLAVRGPCRGSINFNRALRHTLNPLHGIGADSFNDTALDPEPDNENAMLVGFCVEQLAVCGAFELHSPNNICQSCGQTDTALAAKSRSMRVRIGFG